LVTVPPECLADPNQEDAYMKALIFAAALALSGAAIAQTAPASPAGNTVDDPDQSSGPRGVTQQGTDPDGQACTPAGYNAGAGGYAACGGDMGATTSGTASGGMASGTAGGGAMAGNMPACSRTVTDRCTQTYERGVRRR
jgi:hypothetical protein